MMKRFCALILAMMMLLGAGAAESEWTNFQSTVLPVLFDSAEKALESDVSRGIAIGAAYLDYLLSGVSSLLLDNTQAGYLMEKDGQMVFLLPVKENEAGAGCLVLLYDFATAGGSMRTAAETAPVCRDALAPTYEVCHEIPGADVLSAAQAIVDEISKAE